MNPGSQKTLLISLVLGSSLGVAAETSKTSSAPKVESVRSIIDRVKLEKGSVPVRLFAQGKKVTVNLVTPTSPIKAHFHATHEEVVYVLKGRGALVLGKATQEVKEGDLVYIPTGTVHSFVPRGGDCQVLSIFAPAFDGKDRVFVEDP